MDIDTPMTDIQHIMRLPTLAPPPIPPKPEVYDIDRANHTPIVIDNGSTSLRWGFASASTPYVGANAIAKYKERKTNRPLLLFGEGIDAESGARGQAKNPWEGDVLLNFDALVRRCFLLCAISNACDKFSSRSRKTL